MNAGARVDAAEAATRVKKFFEGSHGAYGVLGFRVHAAERTGEEWRIACSFTPGGELGRVRYEVVVGKDGSIASVKEQTE